MAYPQHRSDLIRFKLSPTGTLTLYRTLSGLEWARKVTLKDYLTPMEAAVVLGVHRVTMYSWIRQGLIPAYQIPEGTVLRWGDVRQFGRNQGLLR